MHSYVIPVLHARITFIIDLRFAILWIAAQVYFAAIYSSLRDAGDLYNKTAELIDSVTPDMLRNTWIEIEYQLGILRTWNYERSLYPSACIDKNVTFSDKCAFATKWTCCDCISVRIATKINCFEKKKMQQNKLILIFMIL